MFEPNNCIGKMCAHDHANSSFKPAARRFCPAACRFNQRAASSGVPLPLQTMCNC